MIENLSVFLKWEFWFKLDFNLTNHFTPGVKSDVTICVAVTLTLSSREQLAGV